MEKRVQIINFDDADVLIKALNVSYITESRLDGTFKFTLILNKELKELFIITVADFSDAPDWDCVYSFFVDRNLQLSNGGNFIKVVEGLQDYLSQKVSSPQPTS